jgi:pilus assembly protein Flp/PilA
MKTLKTFVNENEGQDLIEYGMLIAIIALGLLTVLPAIGGKVLNYFTDLNAGLPAHHP